MIDVWNRVITNLTIAETGTCSRVVSTTNSAPSVFPTLAVEQIDDRDAAVDLENSENGVTAVFRIQAFSKNNLTEARNVINVACDAMRTMGFRRTYGPQPILNAADISIYRMEARFQRFIGSLDDIAKFTT